MGKIPNSHYFEQMQQIMSHFGRRNACWSAHIWKERYNQAHQATKDISIFLNVTFFKKPNHTLVEKNVQNTWEAN